jgi:hypothetical protein
MKVRVKFSLEQATKAQRRSRGITLLFNLSARWEWVINTTPRPLYPRERPGTHCTGGWVDLRAGLDTSTMKMIVYFRMAATEGVGLRISVSWDISTNIC